MSTARPPVPRSPLSRTLILAAACALALGAVGCTADDASDPAAARDGGGAGGQGGAGGGQDPGGWGADSSPWGGAADAGAWGGGAGGGGGGWAGEPGGAGGAGGQGGGGGDPGAGAQPWQTDQDGQRFAQVDVGDGETLELRRLRITVRIEGLRARTLIDHVYYNPYDRALEGTFRYTLPSEAAVSWYGLFLGHGGDVVPDFFGPADGLAEVPPAQLVQLTPETIAESADPDVWGELRVGRVVPAEAGRAAYEDITRRPVDPALVEAVAPNTFQARVFPIQARGHNRVLLAYEQTLPRVGDALRYALALPEGPIEQFELIVDGERLTDLSEDDAVEPIGPAEAPTGFAVQHLAFMPGGRYAFSQAAEADSDLDVLTGRDAERGDRYAVVRLTAPADDAPAAGGRRRGIVVLDTSWSATPGRFAVDVALMDAILANTAGLDEFAVLTFDAGARWLTDGWRPNTPEARATLRGVLDAVLLEGATDFGAALTALRKADFVGADPVDVFVLTDGAITWGDGDVERLVQTFEQQSGVDARFFAYRTGLGAENAALFAALTRRGATFNCLTADSVPACSTAHTATGLVLDEISLVGQGPGGAEVSDLIVAGGQATLFPGAQLTVAAKVATEGDAELVLQGRRGEAPVTLRWPVRLEGDGALAPRAWAEIAVARLLAANDPRLDALATTLSQHFRVVSRVTSLLVLEADADYATYDLDAAEAELPEGVGAAVDAALALIGAERDAFEAIEAALSLGGQAAALDGLVGGEVFARLADLAGSDAARHLPVVSLPVPLVLRDAVGDAYLAALAELQPDAQALITEATLRRDSGDPGAALRAISTVIEALPGDSEAIRLVAYRLVSWGLRAPAAHLLFEVLRRRPYEPQAYRDLADVLTETRPALAAALYEVVLAGDWDPRFLRVQTLVAEEYALFIAQQLQAHPGDPLSEWLLGRGAALDLPDITADLRVTITWNTDNTDIDLWVTDPSGDKCFYSNPNAANGGELLDDVTGGFGPERYRDTHAEPGRYRVEVHYYGNNGNRLSAQTQVRATVVRFGGTPLATVQRDDFVLTEPGEVRTVADVFFE